MKVERHGRFESCVPGRVAHLVPSNVSLHVKPSTTSWTPASDAWTQLQAADICIDVDHSWQTSMPFANWWNIDSCDSRKTLSYSF